MDLGLKKVKEGLEQEDASLRKLRGQWTRMSKLSPAEGRKLQGPGEGLPGS